MLKFLKYLLLGFVAVFALTGIVGFFMPSRIDVAQSVIIERDPATLSRLIANLPEFPKWSPWSAMDTTVRNTFSGPAVGVGSTMEWTSEESGSGKMVITAQTDTLITMDLFMDGDPERNEAGFRLAPQGTGTQVTWYMLGAETGNPYTRVMFALFKGMIEEAYLDGLQKLKALAEAAPASAAPEASIQVTEVPEVLALTVKGSCNLAGVSAKLGELYGALMQHAARQGYDVQQLAGAPFAIYHKFDPAAPNGIEIEAGIPLTREIAGSGNLRFVKFPTQKVVKGVYFGSYEGTMDFHARIDEYMRQNNLQAAGPPWEVYITDPMAEPDTTKWQTDILYPIQ